MLQDVASSEISITATCEAVGRGGSHRVSPGSWSLRQIWINSPHNASGYFTIYGEESLQADHFNTKLSFGDPTTLWARTGYWASSEDELLDAAGDRHDALFVVGSLDETLGAEGLRYHPTDMETSVSGPTAASPRGGWVPRPIPSLGALAGLAELERSMASRGVHLDQPAGGGGGAGGSEQDALDLVPLITNVVLEEHHLIVGVVVIVDPGVIPINSRGEKQRMHLRDSFLADQLTPSTWPTTCEGVRAGPGSRGRTVFSTSPEAVGTPYSTKTLMSSHFDLMRRSNHVMDHGGAGSRTESLTMTVPRPSQPRRFQIASRCPWVHPCDGGAATGGQFQVQGVIQSAPVLVIQSPQAQNAQVRPPPSVVPLGSLQRCSRLCEVPYVARLQARGPARSLARRPSYRKILNDLSGEEVGKETSTTVTGIMPSSTPIYQTSSGQYITIAANGTIQAANPAPTGTTILQYAQTSDGQQILVPSNQVVVQGAGGEMQTYQIHTPAQSSLGQTVVMSSPVSMSSHTQERRPHHEEGDTARKKQRGRTGNAGARKGIR
ncbi:unnamed protein product [Boreogadus saida]